MTKFNVRDAKTGHFLGVVTAPDIYSAAIRADRYHNRSGGTKIRVSLAV